MADHMDLLPVEPNPTRHLEKFQINIRPISGMRYLIHFHESSFAVIWERIMREE